MKRAFTVTSHVEGDALGRVLDVPTVRTAQIIAGLLLDLSHGERIRVQRMVDNVLALADSNGTPPVDEPLRLFPADEVAAPVASAGAGTSGE